MRQMMLGVCLVTFWTSSGLKANAPHPAADVYDGWRLGVQTWSFNRFTLFESIAMTRSLGLSWIQTFPGQQLSPKLNVSFGPDLTAEQRQLVREKLRQESIGIFAFGVVGIPDDEAEARKLFEFAKDFNIDTIATEPSFDQFDMIDKLAQEYRIQVAVHNHPHPTRYWDPATVLKVLEGRSKWLGACADVGHWIRSGLDPVECLKKLEGRIFDVHMKEIDTELSHDVVWGTGQARMRAVLQELHRQGFEGTISIEYEHQWDTNLPLIRKSVAYFNRIASTLNPSGWKPLFAPDLSDADFRPDSWQMRNDGVLELIGGGDIWTKEKYADFVLDFDFKVEENTNSGVFLRTQNHSWLPWIEVQIEDSYGKDVSRHICGAIFDIQAPNVNAMRPPGQWNRMTITADGPHIQAVLNARHIIDINLDKWTEAGKNPDSSANKFNVAYKDLPREGYIGFQDHRDGTQVWYRNLNIKEL